ncbi:MAG: DJ-1/PfpI family protein [Pyrinomonadaceae bacterium]|nr:DJ-1/PfpI family protein [Pyrinomonadaceae bacterium]
MNRREFGKLSVAAAIASLIGFEKTKGQTTDKETEKLHQEYMAKYADLMGGDKLMIGMIAYPGMFLPDFVGPLTVFEALMNRDIHIIWKEKKEVSTGSLIKITPNTTFAETPKNLDVLFLPGGVPGTLDLMKDKETLDFLVEKAKTAKYITSVCTGSLILGAAGLLKGYKAASHWVTLDVLKEFGAIPSDARIVEDRNRITGGGVTAGIDFGLSLAAKLRNQTYAEAIQLYIEYNPQPPFNAGSPKNASKEVNAFIGGMLNPIAEQARKIAKEINKS